MTHREFLKRTIAASATITPGPAPLVTCTGRIKRLGIWFHIGPEALARLWGSNLVGITTMVCPACDLAWEVSPFDLTLPVDYSTHPGLWVIPTRIGCYPYSTAFRPRPRSRP